jgi:hypothetical protein
VTQVIRPPDWVNLRLEYPIVFLAGPIQGAPDWQQEAADTIESWDAWGMSVANPRSPEPFHGDYTQQVEWELHYLYLASLYGKVVVWLKCQDPSLNHDPDRAYAQTSRFELGEWVGRSMEKGKRMFILGIEPGFSGERYIRKRLTMWYPDIVIPSTLQGTLDLLKEDLDDHI